MYRSRHRVDARQARPRMGRPGVLAARRLLRQHLAESSRKSSIWKIYIYIYIYIFKSSIWKNGAQPLGLRESIPSVGAAGASCASIYKYYYYHYYQYYSYHYYYRYYYCIISFTNITIAVFIIVIIIGRPGVLGRPGASCASISESSRSDSPPPRSL